MEPDAWAQYCRGALLRSVAAAAAQLPRPGETAPERVHNLRKRLKQARAITRIFLPSLGEPVRVTMTALAATRRQTGRARDLDVMQERLRRLAPPAEMLEPLAAAIARERGLAERGPHRRLSASAARTRLHAIARRIERWDVSGIMADDIAAAVARTYRQARRRGRDAFAGDDPVALHALRARVVDLRYQLSLLSCAWPKALDAQAEALNDLREALGDFNDLEVLGRFAAERSDASPAALAALNETLRAKQEKLRRRAEIAFERLFVEKPEGFFARLAAYLASPVRKPKTAEEGPPAA
jgi:CHAD domain-containing protein